MLIGWKYLEYPIFYIILYKYTVYILYAHYQLITTKISNPDYYFFMNIEWHVLKKEHLWTDAGQMLFDGIILYLLIY